MGIADRLVIYGELWMLGLGSGSTPSDTLIVERGQRVRVRAPGMLELMLTGRSCPRGNGWRRRPPSRAARPRRANSSSGGFWSRRAFRPPSARAHLRIGFVNQSRVQTKTASKTRVRDVPLAKITESTGVQKSAGTISSRSLKRTDNSSAIAPGVASSSTIAQSSSEKDKKNVITPQSIASAMVSVTFNFQLDTKDPSSHAVPDFKSLHASLDAQRMLRRGTPTVPIPVAFHTDARAKEREAFDELVRENEREREAERELRR
ncbi:hypothetical protein B0H10DRAFT_1954507 [Mycena sp. CBHHK59/15]|nr:hypothetical protein B0H10DRAFT_1954507 [Mycena sp. CBHHK59/15]